MFGINIYNQLEGEAEPVKLLSKLNETVVNDENSEHINFYMRFIAKNTEKDSKMIVDVKDDISRRHWCFTNSNGVAFIAITEPNYKPELMWTYMYVLDEHWREKVRSSDYNEIDTDLEVEGRIEFGMLEQIFDYATE